MSVAAEESQPKRALRRANMIRMRGARIRKQLKAGEITFQQALAKKHAQPLRVDYLLRSLPGWGRKRVEKLLHRRLDLDIGSCRISELSKFEKTQLIKGVEDGDYWYV